MKNMKKIKFLGVLSVFIVAILGTTLFMNAAPQVETKTVTIPKQEKVITDTEELQSYSKQFKIPLTSDGGKLQEIRIVTNARTEKEIVRTITPQWALNPYYSIVQKGTSDVCGIEVLHQTSGVGPGSISQQVNEQLAVKLGSTFGASSGVISMGLSFDVTKTYGVTDVQLMTLAAGQVGLIKSFTMYKLHRFDVMYTPVVGNTYKKGSSEALKPIGVCFATYVY